MRQRRDETETRRDETETRDETSHETREERELVFAGAGIRSQKQGPKAMMTNQFSAG